VLHVTRATKGRRYSLRKLLMVALWAALTLSCATPALAQSPGDSDEEVISPASRDQYGPKSIEAAADAARFAASQASEASEAFEEARAAAKSAGADDEVASALAAEAVAAREEAGSERGSARAAPEGRLPETGGDALLVLGTGVLLVACGLVVRRVIG
jgi:hypothetical protein